MRRISDAAGSMPLGVAASTSSAERSTERRAARSRRGEEDGSGASAAFGADVMRGEATESAPAEPDPCEAAEPAPSGDGGRWAVTPPPPEDAGSSPLGIPIASTTTSAAEAASPRAGNVSRGHLMPRRGVPLAAARATPRSARSSSERAKAGPGTGRSSRRATARPARSARSGSTGRPARASSSAASSRVKVSVIDGLSQLLDGAVQERAGVGERDAEDGGELGVVEAGVELQRDQLALARRQGPHRLAQGGAPQRRLGCVLGWRRLHVGRLGGQRSGAPAAP